MAIRTNDPYQRSVPIFSDPFCIFYRRAGRRRLVFSGARRRVLEKTVRIAKPLLMVTTPLGLIDGVYECYKLAGGLVFIMLAMLVVMCAAFGTVVAAIRREEHR
jgi:hypothetical protein